MVTFRDSSVDDRTTHALIAEYFDMRDATFPNEFGAYSRKYPSAAEFVPPKGVFLVVVDDDGQEIGCGGVRSLSPTRFEIKHLWIQPRAQGRGLGRQLLNELEVRAGELGATEFVLDTNASLAAAGNLYRTSGYVNIEPYNENPNATDWFRKQL